MRVMTRQAGSHSPSAPLAANGAVVSTHTELIALRRFAPAVHRWRVFFVLISAVVGQSLCRERRAIRPHSLLSANTPSGCCWTLDCDSRFAPQL